MALLRLILVYCAAKNENRALEDNDAAVWNANRKISSRNHLFPRSVSHIVSHSLQIDSIEGVENAFVQVLSS